MSATLVNQAFCGHCQTKGSEEQQQDPCKITQEQLDSGNTRYTNDGGETCKYCRHSIVAHPTQADRLAILAAQAKAQAESQTQVEIQKAILAPTPAQTQGQSVDISLQWNVANIFERCPEELPDVANLKEFLKEPLAMKLPVFHSYSDQQNFEMSGKTHKELTINTESFLGNSFTPGNVSENGWQSQWSSILDLVFAKAICVSLFQLRWNRNTVETTVTSLSLSNAKQRPDFMIKLDDTYGVTLFKGEEKASNTSDDAVQELVQKMAGLNPSCFGPMPYLLSYATKGPKISFHAITPNDIIHTKSPEPILTFDCTRPDHRAGCFIAIVNIARLLYTLKTAVENIRWLPRYEKVTRNSCVLLANNVSVTKTFKEQHWSDSMKDMYEAIRNVQSTPLTLCPSLIRPTKVEASVRKVTLEPIGFEVVSIPVHAQKFYVLDVLKALCALHQIGLCHNDVRHQNVVCLSRSLDRWMLIDLELAQQAYTTLPGGLNPNHPLRKRTAPNPGISSPQNDVYMLFEIVNDKFVRGNDNNVTALLAVLEDCSKGEIEIDAACSHISNL